MRGEDPFWMSGKGYATLMFLPNVHVKEKKVENSGKNRRIGKKNYPWLSFI